MGIVAVSLPIGLVTLAGCGGGCSQFSYQLHVSSNARVKEGEEVRLGGRRGGTVCSVQASKPVGEIATQLVQVSLNNSSDRLTVDARAVIYPDHIDLSRGSSAAPPLPFGGVLPIAHTRVVRAGS